MDSKIDLALARLNKAKETLTSAQKNLENEDYFTANNRAYYSMFYAMKSALATTGFDAKSHKAITNEFRKSFIKTEILPLSISKMISDSFEIRQLSDYEDFYIVDKEKTREQVKNAETVVSFIKNYISELNKEIKKP